MGRGGQARDSLRIALARMPARQASERPVSAGEDRGAAPVAGVPAPIAASWRRSLAAGLDPGVLVVPHREARPHGSDLVRLAGPVLDRFADSLDGTGVCLVLGDADGTVAHRWSSERGLLSRLDGIHLAPGFDYGERVVGTNAIGTALKQRGASFVVGGQHFAEDLTDMACAAVPLNDLTTGQVVGFLDATSRASQAHPLMLTLVRQAAGDLERVLADAGFSWPGGAPATPPDLTATEHAVADLVVLGLTNRATAHRLSISPHTVDTHLRHIYRKLGVGSRVELARRLLADV